MPREKYKSSIYEDMTQAELKVANFLSDKGIWWNFEQPIYVKDDKERPRVWTPDFYLPELGIYIEVCGTNRRAYKFRKTIYKKNKIPVIFVHTYKYDKWTDYLLEEISRIHKERWGLIKGL